jgi:hypothetical protein
MIEQVDRMIVSQKTSYEFELSINDKVVFISYTLDNDEDNDESEWEYIIRENSDSLTEEEEEEVIDFILNNKLNFGGKNG